MTRSISALNSLVNKLTNAVINVYLSLKNIFLLLHNATVVW